MNSTITKDGIMFKLQTLIHSKFKTNHERVKVDVDANVSYKVSIKCAECGYVFSSTMKRQTPCLTTNAEFMRHIQKKAIGKTISQHYITSASAHNSFVDYETYKTVETDINNGY